MKSRTFLKLALAGLALILFAAAGQVQQSLVQDRQRLGLTRVTVLQNAPPVLAFTTVALGGFRGLIANVLWVRASDLQDEEKFFEMVQLADWITKLEPHYVQVWLVQAWNMTYNISVKFKEPQDRWRWVLRGIELLRDDGLRFNPNETLIYRELAWFFQHKVGQNLDDAHYYYKQMWKGEMQRLLKGRPNYAELLDPQTPEAKERVRELRERYKMDPKIMQEVDKLYGPLEWRLADAHAIYWAELGRRLAKPKDQEALRRVIYQTMQQAFFSGGMTEDKVNEKGFVLGPNFDLMKNVNFTYEKMMAEDEAMRDHVAVGHRNFLKAAIYLLYVDNRRSQAAQWFTYLRQKYPQSLPAGQTVDEFAYEQIASDAKDGDVKKTTTIVEGLLRTGYESLALGDEDKAANYDHLAAKLWERYQSKIAGTEGRVGLEPLPQLKKIVLDQLLDPEKGLQPEYAARLRTALNLPAPAQTPPPAKP